MPGPGQITAEEFAALCAAAGGRLGDVTAKEVTERIWARLTDDRFILGPTLAEQIMTIQEAIADLNEWFTLLVVYRDRLAQLDGDDRNCSLRPIRGVGALQELFAHAEADNGETLFWRKAVDHIEVKPAQPSREALAAVMAAGRWTGIPELKGVCDLPPGSGQKPGFDIESGFYFVLSGTSGTLDGERPALSSQFSDGAGLHGTLRTLISLAHQAWRGSVGELAVALGWPGTPKALSTALLRMEPELEAVYGISVGPTGKRTGPNRLPEWAANNVLNVPQRPALS
jgi:hypothetical protein